MPDRDSIRQTLVELLEGDTGNQFPDLGENNKLREELGLDSVDVVSIISQIERRFRIRLRGGNVEPQDGGTGVQLPVLIDRPPIRAPRARRWFRCR